MARTTAAYLGSKGADRCRECNTKAEATVSGTNPRTGEGIIFRVCLSHTTVYLRTPGVTVAADPEARVALCACNRFIGNNGHAAHKCSAAL